MLVLEPVADGDAPPLNRTVYLPNGTFTLGRPLKGKAAGTADILLHGDSSISKIHAQITVRQTPATGEEGGALTVTVKEMSRYGTFVDGDKVEENREREVKVGNVLKFGYKTVFHVGAQRILMCMGQAMDDGSHHRQAAGRVGAGLTDCMSDEVTHVMVEENSILGPAVLAAVVLDKPVVTPVWLHHLAGSGVQIGSLPPENSFSPASMQLPPYPVQQTSRAASQRLPPASQLGATLLASVKNRLSTGMLAGKIFANVKEENVRYLLVALGAEVLPILVSPTKDGSFAKPARGRRGRSAASKTAGAAGPDIQLVDNPDVIYYVADTDVAKAFWKTLSAKQKKADITYMTSLDLLGCLAHGVNVMSRVCTVSGTGAVVYRAVTAATQAVGDAAAEVIDIDDVTDEETGGDDTDAEDVVEIPASSAAAPSTVPMPTTVCLDTPHAAQTLDGERLSAECAPGAATCKLGDNRNKGLQEEENLRGHTVEPAGKGVASSATGGRQEVPAAQGQQTLVELSEQKVGSTERQEPEQPVVRKGVGRFRGALASLFSMDVKTAGRQDPLELLASSLRGSGTQAVAALPGEPAADSGTTAGGVDKRVDSAEGAQHAQQGGADGTAAPATSKSVEGVATVEVTGVERKDDEMQPHDAADSGGLGKRKRAGGCEDDGDGDDSDQHKKGKKGATGVASVGGWLSHTAVRTPIEGDRNKAPATDVIHEEGQGVVELVGVDAVACEGGGRRKRARAGTQLDAPSSKKLNLQDTSSTPHAAATQEGNQSVGRGHGKDGGHAGRSQGHTSEALPSVAGQQVAASRSVPAAGQNGGASAAELVVVPLVVPAPVRADSGAAIQGVQNFKAFRKQVLVRAPLWTSFVTHRQDGVVGSEEFLQEEKRKASEKKKADDLFNAQIKAGRAR